MPENQPYRITELRISGFRCYFNFFIELHPRLNVILSSNGGGKSSLLDAIGILISPYLEAFDDSIMQRIEKKDVRRIRIRHSDLDQMEPYDHVFIQCSGYLDGAPQMWGEALRETTEPQNTQWYSLREHGIRVRQDASRQANHATVTLPVIAYYKSGRSGRRSNEASAGARENRSRFAAYSGALDASANYHAFEDWFEYLCKAEFEKQMEAAQEARPSHENEFTWLIESIRCAIDDCLRLTGWSHIDYKARLQDIAVTHEAHGTLRVRDLSDGIRGMIALVGDIAYRATRLNPHLQFSAARESPGIILIDEIDLHLHPEWQQSVVNDLVKTFPNMQFIVTTHSPDVVSSVSRECVRRLRWQASQDELEHHLPQACFDYDGAVLIAEIPDHETEGEQVSSVASDVFGVDAWPDLPIVHDLRRYRSLVDQGLYDTPEALALRERLTTHYGADHEELAAAEISIAGQRARRAAQGA